MIMLFLNIFSISKPSQNVFFSILETDSFITPMISFTDLYLPGPGVYFETWLASAKYFPDFTRLNNYPDCPTFVSNGETFEHTIAYSQKMQHGRFRAVFIPKMTGKHRFFIIANNEAQLSIELNPEGPKKILNVNSRTTDDWNQRLVL